MVKPIRHEQKTVHPETPQNKKPRTLVGLGKLSASVRMNDESGVILYILFQSRFRGELVYPESITHFPPPPIEKVGSPNATFIFNVPVTVALSP